METETPAENAWKYFIAMFCTAWVMSVLVCVLPRLLFGLKMYYSASHGGGKKATIWSGRHEYQCQAVEGFVICNFEVAAGKAFYGAMRSLVDTHGNGSAGTGTHFNGVDVTFACSLIIIGALLKLFMTCSPTPETDAYKYSCCSASTWLTPMLKVLETLFASIFIFSGTWWIIQALKANYKLNAHAVGRPCETEEYNFVDGRYADAAERFLLGMGTLLVVVLILVTYDWIVHKVTTRDSYEDKDGTKADRFERLQGIFKKYLGFINSQVWNQFAAQVYAPWSNNSRIQFAMMQTVFAVIAGGILGSMTSVDEVADMADDYLDSDIAKARDEEKAAAVEMSDTKAVVGRV